LPNETTAHSHLLVEQITGKSSKTLGLSIFILVIFSSFVQAAEGSTYGIVPYVDPPSTGSIAGIVGAGGNTGAVCFGLGFRQLATTKQAFNLMGYTILGSAALTFLVMIKGHRSILGGEDSEATKAAWQKTVTKPEDDDDFDDSA
jgi:NNP family nitrate/nitrite transporter-like MFS transporter